LLFFAGLAAFRLGVNRHLKINTAEAIIIRVVQQFALELVLRYTTQERLGNGCRGARERSVVDSNSHEDES